ncbi:VOC family protein [Gordonia alkaliphila]|uniref:VOC family protein n=1 Tax=Gordonia alkaliphila TaxID=1053547 RepID=UPI001FF4195A|nr:VOC family protein [Gordonia alkaliphila]MCK0439940.1 VOC family protein [Gordonia alkaliphila]
MAVTPYLFFSDNCTEAFERYREILGGELQIMRNSDVPEADRMPGGGDFVMHASLTLPDGGLLLGSDDPTGDDGPKTGFAVSTSTPDIEAARTVHAALADGGTVSMPVTATFWSAGFGMCVDRFGVSWMVDVEHAKQ